MTKAQKADHKLGNQFRKLALLHSKREHRVHQDGKFTATAKRYFKNFLAKFLKPKSQPQ